MPLILIDAHLAVILSYFRREEEEYIRMILDQFRLKKYGHSTERFDMYFLQHGEFISDLCCGPICLRFYIVYFVRLTFCFCL